MDEDIESINVVPLVDVLLVLLTIVLTTASFAVKGLIPVDLAQSSHAAPASPVPVVVTLTQTLDLYVNDQPVSELASALQGYAHDQSVVVRADGALLLTELVTLVDRIKSLGFERVALEVLRK